MSYHSARSDALKAAQSLVWQPGKMAAQIAYSLSHGWQSTLYGVALSSDTDYDTLRYILRN